MKPIAYIISQYPEFHETFIAREVEGLRGKGLELRIYSLKPPPAEGGDLYPEHRRLVRYFPFLLSRDLVAANLRALLHFPGRYLSSLTWLASLFPGRPIDLLKALVTFPKAVLISQEIRREGSAVHAHWATMPASMAAVVKILTGAPFTLTAHAWDIFLTPAEVLARKISLASGVMTCTAYNGDYLRKICYSKDRSKIAVNYHGLDFGSIPGPASPFSEGGAVKVLAVGRLVEQKGFGNLIRAAGELAERGVKVSLTIIGEGPLRCALQALAQSCAGKAEVLFAGRVPHELTLRQMAESDLLAAPSVVCGNGDRDGIPNVVLEALACGLPVVGTAVSGIPEVVIHNRTGIVVPPGDPVALADGIHYLTRFPEKARLMGSEGRRLALERFDVKTNIAEFIGLLEQFHGWNKEKA